jgi:putative FmdB family regulatory protein
MPTYEYNCEECDHTFEVFQAITAPPMRKCPSCGAIALKRLIGAGAGIIFKGSGFYQTDYRSESYQKASKAESTSASSTPEKRADSAGKSRTGLAAGKKAEA